MRKISNPFGPMAAKGEYNCFGCSPSNDIGLHLEFWEDGEVLISRWDPQKGFEGWKGVLHGGIQATLMDEMAAWVVFIKLKTAGVTSGLQMRFQKPVFTSKGPVTVRGRLISVEKRLAKIECNLFDGENEVCAIADVTYFHFPEKIARVKYKYPGIEAFLPEK
jgi:uncharacterized protein (TIGR00369 family)